MKKEGNKMIVTNVNELNDPFVCYAIMMLYMNEAGEDFIDYNERIVSGWPFAMWLRGKGYISEIQLEQLSALAEPDLPMLQEILMDDTLFPESYGNGDISNWKAYQVLADYISGFSIFRQALWNAASDGSDSFSGGFYKDENGVSLALKIPEDDMNGKKFSLKELKEMDNVFCLTLKDQYETVRALTFEECDF